MFVLHPERPRLFLIGEAAGILPILEFAERTLERSGAGWEPFVLVNLHEGLALRPRPSTILIPGIPSATIACIPALEELGIPSRIASETGEPGCYEGDATALAADWLGTLDDRSRATIELLACGPNELQPRIASVAARYGIQHQFALAADQSA